MMENSAKSKLFDLLVTKDFDPEILGADGKAINDPNEAQMFSFDWKTPNKNYGTVVLTVGDPENLKVFFGDNLGQGMEGSDSSDWFNFLQQIKQFAIRNNYKKFTPENISRLKYTMQGMAAIKEGLFEGYYGNKKFSYSDQPKQVKLVIKHSHPLGENEKRYRNIDSLFVETADGERFKVPSRNLSHGKMLARHVAEGGNPYDAFGVHIGEVVKEMNILRKFVRAAQNKQFDSAAQEMCETAIRHYQDLKAKAKRMISQRGYHREFESFDPAAITPSEEMAESVRNMFVQQTLDSRIEEAIPFLAKLTNESNMKEAEEFESWANTVVEGTWATPDTPEAENELKELLSKPFPVGPDAMYATEKLYNILGDDELFDRLQALADQDPDADCRDIIVDRLSELDINIDVPADQVPTPAEPQDADTPPEDMPPVGENLDVDGVMMTKPSNMSSESVERILKLAQLLK